MFRVLTARLALLRHAFAAVTTSQHVAPYSRAHRSVVAWKLCRPGAPPQRVFCTQRLTVRNHLPLVRSGACLSTSPA